jgi:Skp family chaperone for outer membrane proteins
MTVYYQQITVNLSMNTDMFKTILSVLMGIVGYHYFIHMEKNHLDIGIINLSRVEQESKSYTTIRKFLDNEHKKIKDSVLQLEEAQRQFYEQLKQAESQNNPSVVQMRQEFNKKNQEIENYIQNEKERLRILFKNKQDQLDKKITQFIDRIVKKYNLSLLVNSNIDDEHKIVIYGQQSMNYTDIFIKMLDDEH